MMAGLVRVAKAVFYGVGTIIFSLVTSGIFVLSIIGYAEGEFANGAVLTGCMIISFLMNVDAACEFREAVEEGHAKYEEEDE